MNQPMMSDEGKEDTSKKEALVDQEMKSDETLKEHVKEVKTKETKQTKTKDSASKSTSSSSPFSSPQRRRKKHSHNIDQILHLSTIENTKRQLITVLKQNETINSPNENDKSDLPDDFISTDRLLRPTFSFIHTVIKIFIQKLSFASTLYNNHNNSNNIDHNDKEELLTTNTPHLLTRQQKIKFLFKILHCISILTNERMDILVSPAKILSGQDVHSTLLFLQCLCKAVNDIPMEKSMAVANDIVLNEKDGGLNLAYKKSIKIRNTIVRIQAIYRGSAIRRKILLSSSSYHSILKKKCEKKKKNEVVKKVLDDTATGEEEHEDDQIKVKQDGEKSKVIGTTKDQIKVRQGKIEKNTEATSNNKQNDDEQSISSTFFVVDKSTSTAKKRGRRNYDNKKNREKKERSRICRGADSKELYHTVNKGNRYKPKLTPTIKDTKEAEKERNQPNKMKAKSIIPAKQGGKSLSGIPQVKEDTEDMISDAEKSAATTPINHPSSSKKEKTLVKKFKIINGIKTKQEIEIIQHSPDKDESKKNNNEEEVAALLAKLKSRMQNLKKRESKLNEKMEATKQKEEHLHIFESRISRLADSLRNKQERLVQERINQTMEMDKLRLEASTGTFNHNRNKIDYCHEDSFVTRGADNGNDEDKYETLWKSACDNPTITDLRLKLEAKERAMRKKQDRIVKMEKDLIKRMEQVEEEKKQVDDEKRAMNETKKKNAQRKNRKPLKHNRDETSKSPETRKLQRKDDSSTLLQQFVQASSERGQIRTQKRKSSANVKAKEVPSIVHNLKNQEPHLHSLKESCRTRRITINGSPHLKKSGANATSMSDTNNESSSDKIPQSLVRYTIRYGKIGR